MHIHAHDVYVLLIQSYPFVRYDTFQEKNFDHFSQKNEDDVQSDRQMNKSVQRKTNLKIYNPI